MNEYISHSDSITQIYVLILEVRDFKITMQNLFVRQYSPLIFLTFSIPLLFYYNHFLYVGVLSRNQRRSITNVPEKVVILFWTAYFGGPFPAHHFFNPNISCHKNCFLVFNRSYLFDSDAVVFHSRDLRIKDLPQFHPENQIWVYMQQESPIHTVANLKKFGDTFNWTMTYRRDSDVYHPYFRVLNQPSDSSLKFMNEGLLEEKTKLVAWVASHCYTNSRRENYAKKLQKFIPVDIYGRCGTLKCSEGEECFSELGKQYKFYLSFENSYCKDYITEKLANALKNNLVPIVMGGGDYEAFTPPRSFINVDDFSSVEALAKHLIYLDKNPDEYMKYFEWQSSNKIADGDGFCDLCAKIRAQKVNPRKKVYVDLWKWWYYVEPNYGEKLRKDLIQIARSSNKTLFHENFTDHSVFACDAPTWKAKTLASPSS